MKHSTSNPCFYLVIDPLSLKNGEDIAHTIYFTEKLSEVQPASSAMISMTESDSIVIEICYIGESIYEEKNSQPPKHCNKGFSMDFGSIGHAK